MCDRLRLVYPLDQYLELCDGVSGMGRKSLYFITESWRKMLLYKGHALDTLAESLNIYFLLNV